MYLSRWWHPVASDTLAYASKGLVLNPIVASAIYLSNTPIVETIRVSYGTQDIPKDERAGWSYDASLNAIFLGPDFQLDMSQPDGTKIQAHFDTTTYNENLTVKK